MKILLHISLDKEVRIKFWKSLDLDFRYELWIWTGFALALQVLLFYGYDYHLIFFITSCISILAT